MNQYLSQGINCIAVNEHKRAIFPWKEYQSRMITEAELERQMSDSLAKGIAVICGSVSGNLEVIDLDLKYATYDLWSQIEIPQTIKDKLFIVKTRNNGLHIYYRCEIIEGNQKLAMRHATHEEKKTGAKTFCLIETRGEGGYVVAPPSEGYEIISGQTVQVISLDEREELLGIMRSFNEVYEEMVVEAHQRPKEYGASPFDDYNKRGDLDMLLISHGWSVVRKNSVRTFYKRPGGESETSGSYNHDMGLFSVFSTNTPFNVGKGYRPYAVFAILECNSDFKLAAKKLVDLGYGERNIMVDGGLRAKKLEGLSNEDLVEHLIRNEKKTLGEAQKIVEALDEEENILKFWDVEFRKGRAVVTINRYKLQIFLSEEGGFRLYFYDKASTIYRLVRIKDGFVEETSAEQVKKFIKDYVDRLPMGTFDGGIQAQDILELVYKQGHQLFSEGFFEFFPHAEIEFLRDTKDVGYFPFRNGVVCVTKDNVVLKSYAELNKCIWKNNVIEHDILVDQGVDPDRVEYFRFLKKVSGDEPERYMYALSLIGYLLHQYKDPSRPFAVILGEETDNEEKGGGTGKGIFVKALSYIVKTIRVDGKNFNLGKNFAFQRVDLDTRIVAIEDTRKKVDFEAFYSIITEGITVEKKNQDEFFIPYKDSPKIMFTTNYSIPQSGVHAKRRQRVFEFSPYFSNLRTPEDEFGHKLFDDWDKDEWNRFFNLLFFALQDYLCNGVVNVEFSQKMAKKALKNQFGEEFLAWFEEFLGQPESFEWVSVENLHNEFLGIYGLDKKEYSRKRFSSAIKCGTELMKIQHEISRSVVERNKIAIRLKKQNNEDDMF